MSRVIVTYERGFGTARSTVYIGLTSIDSSSNPAFTRNVNDLDHAAADYRKIEMVCGLFTDDTPVFTWLLEGEPRVLIAGSDPNKVVHHISRYLQCKGISESDVPEETLFAEMKSFPRELRVYQGVPV